MTYGIQTLTITDQAGNIDRLPNPSSSGQVLISTGTTTSPDWKTLAQANIAAADAYLPITGGTLTGALTGTTAAFTGITLTGGSSGVVKATSGALSIGSVALGSEVSGTLPVGSGGTGQTSITGIMYGTGSAISTVSTTNVASGSVLKYTGSGYTFDTIGNILPPITSLTCASSGTTIANDMFLRAGANVTDNPTWQHITASNIYGASNSYPSVLISAGGATSGTSTGNWLPTDTLSTTPQILAALSGSGNGLRFYNPADLGLITSIPAITSLSSGATSSDVGKILSVSSTSPYNAEWIDKVPVAHGGTGANTLTGILLGNGTNPITGITATDSNTFLKWTGSQYTFAAISDITGAYLPLAGGVMHGVGGYGENGRNAPLSTNLLENYGRYYGLAWTEKTSDTNSTSIVIETSIAANTTSGFPTPSDEKPFQVLVTGFDLANNAKTLNVKIVLAITSSGSPNLDTSHSGWTSSGTAVVTNVEYAVNSTTNKYILRLTVPSSKYRVNVDGLCDYVVTRDQYWVDNVNTYLYGLWSISTTASGSPTFTSLNQTWNYLKDIPTGISTAGIVRIDSNQKLTVSGNAVTVAEGGTGKSSLTAYALLAGGTTATGDIQQVTTGTSGQVLVSNGSSALPSFQTLTIPSAPTNLPLVDNETGSLGTAGTYATEDHQHPLPYSVTAAKKLYTARRIGIGGAVTAVSQEFDGTGDILLITENIDPNYILGTIPISKIPTGTSSSTVAVGNHTHSTYLPKAGGDMTGAINFPASLTTPVTWPEHSGIAYFGAGELSVINDVSFAVKGNTEFRQIFEADFQESGASEGVYQKRVDLVHTNHKNTVYNIACGEGSQINNFVRNIKLPSPTADNLGDKLTIYFTKKTSQYNGSINATCATTSRLMKFDYTSTSSLTWSNGNIVEFVCVQMENNGSDYFWRAIKLVEQSW